MIEAEARGPEIPDPVEARRIRRGLTRLALTVLGGTGLVGIVLGFAFREIAENSLASILLSIRNPFRAGDWIQVGEHQGIVQNLNMRTRMEVRLGLEVTPQGIN